MDEMSCGWLVEYENELRERGFTQEEINKLVLEAVK